MTFNNSEINIERKPESSSKKPRLSADRWQQFTEDIKPVLLDSVRIKEVNLGMCHKEVFTFISKCKNSQSLLLYDITDDSGDDSDIVQGVTSVLPKLVKLGELEIQDVYLLDHGKSLLDNINSPDLRTLSLEHTHLDGNGGALTSCLSRLPLLSYLYLFNSGLSKVELIQVIQVLPSSCPNLLFLDIVCASLSNVELKPVFLLKYLRHLVFDPSSAEDLIEALYSLPKTLQLLCTEGNVRVSHRMHEFISAVKSLPRLRFLVVNEGCLDSGGEQKVSEVLKQTGGRVINNVNTDPQALKDYQDQAAILRNECFNAT